jgi:tetratricopeptide (TPR) repeat protein
MSSVSDELQTAWQHHQSGNLHQAEQIYRQVLEANPQHPRALHLLGLLGLQAGRHQAAIDLINRSLALNAAQPMAHFHLGIAYHSSGKLAEAVASYQQAARLQPELADVHNNLGNALREQGRFDEAISSYQQALRIKPDFAHACNNLGIVLAQKGQLNEAVAAFQKALQLQPDYAVAYSNLGLALGKQGKPGEAMAAFREAIRVQPGYAEAYHNLGNAQRQMGHFAKAVESYEQAIQLQLNIPEVHDNLGIALSHLGRFDEAVASLRTALKINPEFAEAYNTLGNTLQKQGRFEEGAEAVEQALRLKPQFAEAHNTLGVIRSQQRRLTEALDSYQKALQLKPDHAEAHLNRGMVWLQQGALEAGWAEFEWRFGCRNYPPRPFRQPRWDGSALSGRSILLHAEMGLGDTIHFVRYAPLVKERGGRVVVEAQAVLLPLLARTRGIDQLVARDAPLPEFDVHAPLLSVPYLLGTTLATIPADIPYVFPDPELVEQWRRELSAVAGFKVGVAWCGSATYPGDTQRSIPVRHFAPLACVAGVHLCSLQKGPGSEELQALEGRFPVTDLASRLDEKTGAFMDTAAAMKSLDLIVTADTSIGHLAGALGVPVWLALGLTPHWPWFLHRESTPWYPMHRLFRRDAAESWDDVFERMAAALRQRLQAPPAAQTVLTEVAPGELIDKITILQIKSERMTDQAKLHNVKVELATLLATRDRATPASEELTRLTDGLKGVNEALWEIEDEIRVCERNKDFGEKFIELARSVYKTNDRRAALKRQVNDLLGSRLIEEKDYKPYD